LCDCYKGVTKQSSRPVPAGPIDPTSGFIDVGTTGRQSTPATTPYESHSEKWWIGKGLLQGSGNPVFDGRKSLEDRGLNLNGSYQSAFFGVIDSEKRLVRILGSADQLRCGAELRQNSRWQLPQRHHRLR
jgi:hypothetical protein